MPAACKRSSLLAIVNRLYLSAGAEAEEAGSEDVGATTSLETKPNSSPSRPQSSHSVVHSAVPSPAPTPLPLVVPVSSEATSDGLTAVGGCRQCSRTFTDRLSLIHHFVDHFPAIFYSFETAGSARSIPLMLFPLPGSAVVDQKLKRPAESPKTDESAKKSRTTKAKVTPTAEKSVMSSRFTDFAKSTHDLPYDMCPHCCQTFADHGIYRDHLKTHDTPVISLGAVGTGESPLKCEYCDLRFSNEYLLKEHKNVHCRVCSVCSKTLMTTFDLNLHMGTHSGFSYDCKDCGRCFPDRKTLALHNKMHRTDLSAIDSDEDKSAVVNGFCKENVRRPRPDRLTSIFGVEDKPESFFKSNPYFENIFKQSPRKRRQRSSRSGDDSKSKRDPKLG